MTREDALMRVRVLGAMYRRGELTAAEWADETEYVLIETFPGARSPELPRLAVIHTTARELHMSTSTGTPPLSAA